MTQDTAVEPRSDGSITEALTTEGVQRIGRIMRPAVTRELHFIEVVNSLPLIKEKSS